jgi:predicted Fe-Mo cluster-binding NifX family protein
MKIAIPVDNNSLDTSICISFGRAPHFLIYDTKTDGIVLWITVRPRAREEQELKLPKIL